MEFALIGSAFFLFVLGIFIVSIEQYWQMTLDDAVRAAARQTSITNTTGSTISNGNAFVAAVCNEFGITAVNCSTALNYSVQSGAYFYGGPGTASITPQTLVADGTLYPSGNTFSLTSYPGAQPGVAVYGTTEPNTNSEGHELFLLVQVSYPLPFTIPLIGGALTENGTNGLYSTVAMVMQ